MRSPRSALLLLLLLSCMLPMARSEIIGIERFDYADGAIAGKNGGTGWDYKNTAPAGHDGTPSTWDNLFGGTGPVVVSGMLSTNLATAKREFNGPGNGTGSEEDNGGFTDGRVNQVLYMRVILTTQASLPDVIAFSAEGFGTERIIFGKRSGQSFFGIEAAGFGSVNSTVTVQPNSTYTLVAKVDYVANQLSLFVDPLLGIAEPAAQAVLGGYTSANATTAVRLGTSSGTVLWDNLLVATSWSDLRTIVTTPLDEDDGSLGGGTGVSLREAVKYSANGTISFDPALSGTSIVLLRGQMDLANDVTVDANMLPKGITLDAAQASRHFDVGIGKTLTLRGLTLTGGRTLEDGASILNSGTLNLERCTFHGNTAAEAAGAVSTLGRVTAVNTTFAGNTAGFGGALYSQSLGTIILRHCTITDNNAITHGGGGILAYGEITLENTIVSRNNASSAMDVSLPSGTVTRRGANLIGRNDGATAAFPAGLPNAQGDYVGTSAAPLDPKLSLLAQFGGTVPTVHPLVGSPAIDTAGGANPGGSDARGFSRFIDGDNSGTAQLDIGAVEAGPLFRVDSSSDSGSIQSLRGNLASVTTNGSRIAFNPPVFSVSPVTLLIGEITLPGISGLFFDGSNITGGVTISGNSSSRIFNIPAGATVAMQNLALANGRAADSATTGQSGGGVINSGTLTLIHSSLSGCAAGNANVQGGHGGGISSSGSLTLLHSVVSGNSAGNALSPHNNGGQGGGIYNSGTLVLLQSTVSGNKAGSVSGVLPGGHGGGIFNAPTGVAACTASTLSGNTAGNNANGGGGYGGGFSNRGRMAIDSSTIAGNAAGSGTTAGNGGGAWNEFSGSLRLRNTTISGNFGNAGGGISNGGNLALFGSIVSGNSSSNASMVDMFSDNSELIGTNLIGSLSGAGTLSGPAPLTGNAMLAPLGDYGGPTATRPPLPGSPVINALAAIREIQRVNIGGLPLTFTLTFRGETTAPLNQNSTAGQVQDALGNLTVIGSGNVSVTQTSESGSTLFLVTFTGTLGGENQPQMSSDNASVTTVQNGLPVTRTTDQRGFRLVGLTDLGAVEYQGDFDLRRYWPLDWDGDGNAFGVEYALGTDPLAIDSGHARNLRFTRNGSGQPVTTFGLNFDAISSTTWILKRSTTLLPGSFTEVFRVSPGIPAVVGSGIYYNLDVTGFQITDTTPPAGGKAFYRLEAVAP